MYCSINHFPVHVPYIIGAVYKNIFFLDWFGLVYLSIHSVTHVTLVTSIMKEADRAESLTFL
jgi:hypothetical protein